MLTQTTNRLTNAQNPGLPPLVREFPADLDTPVSVYLKLANGKPSFMLESVTGGEQIARYSFIGSNLQQAYVLRGSRLEHHTSGGIEVRSLPEGQNPLEFLRAELAKFQSPPIPGLPRFSGGLVGFLGYELAHYLEPAVPLLRHGGPEAESNLPDAVFLLADALVAFDHAFGRLLLIANPHPTLPLQEACAEAEARLDDLQQRLAMPLPPQPSRQALPAPGPLQSNKTFEEYCTAVKKAKEYIATGDIFQVVLSQRFSRKTSAAPFSIYRALRRLNPSPYMFYFDFGDIAGLQKVRIMGASPEMHVRLESRDATLRPIAGTRPRGKSPSEDQAMKADLLADPKERAEHIMLVDLARNDLGRVCEYGTVAVPEFMRVEQYSHVMHIVSRVDGMLKPEYDSFDLMRATYPAGTVTGAPKIRAMQIIAELEDATRGPYAGAVGYFSFAGNMDTCITIRTLVMVDETVYIQSGAGIVADSDPEREYQETLNKARALAMAVEMAEA
jgi:anthranilate synthase component 1